jgi:hypothetical protein
MKKFMAEYKKFILDFKDNPKVDWFAEMDIEENTGLRQVEKWFEELRTLSDKVMPVWHPARGKDRWLRYIRENKYVGTGGTWKFLPTDTVTHMSILAYDAGARHHGFGCTSTRLMTAVPMFSTDSTSWLAGEQYGQAIQVERFLTLSQRGGRKTPATDQAILEITKPYRRRTIKMIDHYRRYAEYVTRLWEKRGIAFTEIPCSKSKTKSRPSR